MSQLGSLKIKREAQRLGFNHCGMAPAVPVDAHYVAYYRHWLAKGNQAEMHYLENYFEKRMDPRLLVEGTKTIVSLAMNYRPSHAAEGIAWYAQGKDYHDLLRDRMALLMEAIGAHGRCFVDTAPVPERYWAWRCGLGWIGKHSQLVIPHEGSTFFLGELFIEEEVDTHDTPMANHCGNCHRCIDACPAGAIAGGENGAIASGENGAIAGGENDAIVGGEVTAIDGGEADASPACAIVGGGLDARKCLSYLTIENRGDLPEGAKRQMGETFYGCDRCLKACPHLKVAPTEENSLRPSEALLAMTPEDWQHLTVEEYRTLFKGSAVKRAKYEGLMRNIQSLKFSSKS